MCVVDHKGAEFTGNNKQTYKHIHSRTDTQLYTSVQKWIKKVAVGTGRCSLRRAEGVDSAAARHRAADDQ